MDRAYGRTGPGRRALTLHLPLGLPAGLPASSDIVILESCYYQPLPLAATQPQQWIDAERRAARLRFGSARRFRSALALFPVPGRPSASRGSAAVLIRPTPSRLPAKQAVRPSGCTGPERRCRQLGVGDSQRCALRQPTPSAAQRSPAEQRQSVYASALTSVSAKVFSFHSPQARRRHAAGCSRSLSRAALHPGLVRNGAVVVVEVGAGAHPSR